MDSIIAVASFNWPPFFTITPNSLGNATYSGYCVDVLRWIALHLKIQLRFVVPDPINVERYGLPQAMMDQLMRKEVDLVPFSLMQNVEREQVLDFTNAVSFAVYRFMVPYPNEESRTSAIIKATSPPVWTVFVASNLAAVAFLSIYKRLFFEEGSNHVSLLAIINRRILYCVSISSGRSGSGNYFILPQNSRFPVRLVVGLWLLMSVIIGCMYTTSLTSFLTVTKFKPIPSSFHDLANNSDYKLVVPMDSDFAQFCLKTEIEPYKTLGNSLRNQRPSVFLANLTQVLYDTILELRGAYAQPTSEVNLRIALDMKKHGGHCRFTSSKALELSYPLPMALRKGDPTTKLMNHGIMRLRESGLGDHWLSSYRTNIDKCLIKEHKSLKEEVRSVKPFSMSQLLSAFLLLGIGISLSFISFLGELLMFKSYRSTGE